MTRSCQHPARYSVTARGRNRYEFTCFASASDQTRYRAVQSMKEWRLLKFSGSSIAWEVQISSTLNWYLLSKTQLETGRISSISGPLVDLSLDCGRQHAPEIIVPGRHGDPGQCFPLLIPITLLATIKFPFSKICGRMAQLT